MGPSPRAAAAALAVLLPGAMTSFVACSSRSGAGGDASEASVPEAGAPPGDSSVHHDAAPSDSGDAALAYPDGSGFSGDCGVGEAGEPTDLRCTGLYADWASKTVAPDMQPYDPGLHLWSDGADKTRWIYLPPGQTIDTSDMDEWTMPVGTKVFKEFSRPAGDASTGTRIETRLLWKQGPGTWYRTTYAWSDDGVSSATELTDGQLDAGGTGYEIPRQDECDECHKGRKDGVLGFEAVSLSSPGASGLTLPALAAQGLLSSPPTSPIVIPGDPVEVAALAYLHANCGTACHNRGAGTAAQTGFYMRLDVATLASVQTTDTYATGWNQPAQNFHIFDAGVTNRLYACNTSSSCVYYRASRRSKVDGVPYGVQMPPLDTHAIDEAGLAAIAAWIDEGCDAGTD